MANSLSPKEMAKVNALLRLMARADRTISSGLKQSIDNVTNTLTDEALILGAANMGPTVERLLTSAALITSFRPLQTAIMEAYNQGGKGVALLQKPITGNFGKQVIFEFNRTNPMLERAVANQTAARIVEFSTEMKQVAQKIISRNVLLGNNPRVTAKELRQGLGLTINQEQAVTNYRAALTSLDSSALTRALRDSRSDNMVMNAINNAKPLSEEKIDSLVNRYRSRAINLRAETIARTESTTALQTAQHDLFTSYVKNGQISVQQVRRFWQDTADAKTRIDHIQIPLLNPNGVGLDEPFQTPLGPLMYPGDPAGDPANIINCRCTVFTRIISQELLDDVTQNVEPLRVITATNVGELR